ncbi:MAG TPA: OsmC family protein [Solirubrobacteraceae bacterium]|nr:OsmC family protein [Solirubrobacteraceae bacterium]
MDLRDLQRPLKERYRSDPSASRITLSARGGEAAERMPTQCSVDLGRAIYEAEAHPGVGGPGTGACSGDLLLGALAACAQLTCQMVATAMGLDARRIEVVVEGDLDLRGTLGVDREVSAGFEAIRLRFEIDAPDASDEDLEGLIARTERYCTVLQTLRRPPSIEAVRAGAAAAK